MKDTDNKYCSLLLDVIIAHGVRNIVCSPGSRNTPLLIAAAARKDIKKHIIVDERSAAYFALGLSKVSKSPVALICTSGTALLNYAPAIAEAYYSGTPLIVLSADRPLVWIDQDDSQTIRQPFVFDNFIKGSFDIPVFQDNDEDLMWYVNRIANESINTALNAPAGPVHVNVRISEPLNGKVDADFTKPRLFKVVKGDILGNKEILNELADKLSCKKIMIVAGFMAPDSALQKAISNMSSLPDVVVMAETISNLHLKENACAVDSVLSSLSDIRKKEMAPDLIIFIGGSLVSRKLKEYLRSIQPDTETWTIGFSHNIADCFKSLTLKLEVDPVRFFRHIYPRIKKRSLSAGNTKYKNEWNSCRMTALKVKEEFIRDNKNSELYIFNKILNKIDSNCNLFLSNGTAVRYAQIIDYRLPHASYCNRGVSGIDGTVSTALGGAVAYKGKTILITGDLSFLYDINALGIRDVPPATKIIVIDNGGGGIFRFIPSTSGLEEREEYFCVKPLIPFKEIAEGFGWNFMESSAEMFSDSLFDAFLSADEKSLLRIICNGEESARILKEYMTIKI